MGSGGVWTPLFFGWGVAKSFDFYNTTNTISSGSCVKKYAFTCMTTGSCVKKINGIVIFIGSL